MIKTEIQDLPDIINIKNTSLSDKNSVTNMSYVLSKQKLCKKMNLWFYEYQTEFYDLKS